ncbi:MAG: ABC transporter permease [Pseudolabrys sp.]|nr:ABC transporter permease [Pseudolabrys sp.]
MISKTRIASHVAGSVILAFMVLPILAVLPASFENASYIKLPPDTFSLRWYRVFLADPEWWQSLITSGKVAVLATVISLFLGTTAALGMQRVSPPARAVLTGLVISPLVVPVIMTAIALYYVMRPLGLHGTMLGLALGHTLLALPFVVVNVGISLRGVDANCLRAAEGLGAAPLRVFRTVTLPLILPGLAGGGAFAFVASFDEVVVSIFLAGVQAKTLPVKMWETIRVEFTPVTAVASTILIAVTLVLFISVKWASSAARTRRVAHVD